MRVFVGLADLKAAAGHRLGTSEWLTVDESRVGRYFQAVGGSAARPGEVPEALVLSLIPTFVPQIFRVDDVAMGVNYGFNEVRYPTPVPTGGRVRGQCTFVEVGEVPGGVQVTNLVTVELAGSDQPACH